MLVHDILTKPKYWIPYHFFTSDGTLYKVRSTIPKLGYVVKPIKFRNVVPQSILSGSTCNVHSFPTKITSWRHFQQTSHFQLSAMLFYCVVLVIFNNVFYFVDDRLLVLGVNCNSHSNSTHFTNVINRVKSRQARRCKTSWKRRGSHMHIYSHKLHITRQY